MSLNSRVFQRLARSVVIAASFAAPPAFAGTGDLHLEYADHGRLASVPRGRGAVKSLELLEDGRVLFGGGNFDVGIRFNFESPRDQYYEPNDIANFVRVANGDGVLDPSFGTAGPANIEAVDVVRQADGAAVVVGRSVTFSSDHRSMRTRLVAYRFLSNGSLDAFFGTNGVFEWDSPSASQGRSVALDPDGNIVVAGTAVIDAEQGPANVLVVLRLLPGGYLDPTFGQGGVYTGPPARLSDWLYRFFPEPVLTEIQLATDANGGYRISVGQKTGCIVVGITSEGTPDPGYGDAGIANLKFLGGHSVVCKSLAPTADGGVLVAGSVVGRAFLVRLLANGAIDPSFVADRRIRNSMEVATSVAVAPDGKVLVAGRSGQRASIARLQPLGARDTLFGEDGRTWIDLASDRPTSPIIHAIAVLEDGGVIAAGGDSITVRPFVVRLRGDPGGKSPGVLGFEDGEALPLESDGHSVLRVRRTGGSDGDVSISYRTMANAEATADDDFLSVSGTLHWADGDTSTQEVSVDVLQDSTSPELYEAFQVRLAGARGRAGLGMRTKAVTIQPDGSPGGQIEIETHDLDAGENGAAQIFVRRNFYFSGRVCVTVTAKSGTATAGKDFSGEPVVICWEDQDAESKLAEIPIIDDGRRERIERFTVEISNPTGGAIVGPVGTAIVKLYDNDQPAAPTRTSPPEAVAGGGGGALGMLEALLVLGLVTLRRLTKGGIRPGAMTLVAFAIGLAVPQANAATGDLDPSFADQGRLYPIPRGSGEARSVVLTEAGGILVGGGSLQAYREPWSGRPNCHVWTSNYARLFGAHGRVDKSYQLEYVPSMEAFDLARQADGSVIAVGRRITGHTADCDLSSELAAYRLGANGLLDTGFGLNGFFQWANGGDSQARALVLEPDGRIVIAGVGYRAVNGEQQSMLVVLRLLANGEFDATFGNRGVYVGPQVDYLNPIRIVRTSAGEYRVSANGAGDCAIVGLTSAGGPDAGFGVAGVAAVESQDGIPVFCESLALIAKDRLLVAGSGPKRVFVSRLRANGTRDPTFTPDPAIAEAMTQATAIAPGGENTVLVAGISLDGASIMRLLSSGELDLQFGDAGRTWIDLPSEHLVVPWVHDMAVQRDRSVIAVGGSSGGGPFVVRLLGRNGGAAPGVVGFSEDFRRPTEAEGRTVFRVRRRGGSDGAVSVKYRSNADSEATSGQDFSARSGTLQWADGDTSERRVVMQVLPDRTTEGPEFFRVLLRDAQGGVGVGTRAANVEIQADGAPAGQVMFSDVPSIPEESGVGQFWLGRDYHFDGRVCVTMTARPGTAKAGEDFDAGASTVCWEDQDYEGKLIEIAVVDDHAREGDETFTVELSNPTGGALIGGPSSYLITILDND